MQYECSEYEAQDIIEAQDRLQDREFAIAICDDHEDCAHAIKYETKQKGENAIFG